MIRHNQKKREEYSRRDFMKFLSAIGFLTAIPVVTSNANQHFSNLLPDGAGLTIDTIKEAEKLVGMSFSAKQRGEILEDLLATQSYLGQVQELNIGYSTFPIISFIDPHQVYSDLTVSLDGKIELPATDLPAKEEELAFLSIPQLGYLVKSGKISSSRLTRIFLKRLKKYNSRLLFAITITEALALAQAEQADKEIREGKYRGILHGIPYGLKDLFAVEGYPTTWGIEDLKIKSFPIMQRCMKNFGIQEQSLLQNLQWVPMPPVKSGLAASHGIRGIPTGHPVDPPPVRHLLLQQVVCLLPWELKQTVPWYHLVMNAEPPDSDLHLEESAGVGP